METQQAIETEEQAQAAASSAAGKARAHADAMLKAYAHGHERFGGLWYDDAEDWLFDHRAELGKAVYVLARELLRDERGGR
jgi:hypothetical protein